MRQSIFILPDTYLCIHTAISHTSGFYLYGGKIHLAPTSLVSLGSARPAWGLLRQQEKVAEQLPFVSLDPIVLTASRWPPCQPTCSGHCTSQWSPAQTRPWSWGSVTQRPRSQCRQRLDCPRSTSGSSSGGTQVRWGAGRKKSGGPRAWGASPHPLTLSVHLRTVQPVLLWRGRGARPGRGARSPRMGQRGCTVPAGRARCTAVGLC